jgi:hypothetical protein
MVLDTIKEGLVIFREFQEGLCEAAINHQRKKSKKTSKDGTILHVHG